jgi:hypothetical protein
MASRTTSATIHDVDAPQVEVVQALCDDLASMSGVLYAACERRGAATIAEGGDRRCLFSGPFWGLQQELVAVVRGIVFRVVYDEHARGADVQTATQWAGTTLRRLLERQEPGTMPPPRGGNLPPGGLAGAAPAQIGVHDGARKRWLS